jgi:cellulase
MRTAAAFILAAAELVAGHATFQFIAKNGGAQSTTGVRGTSNQNNPILSTADALASDMMICKGGAAVAGSFEVAGGDKLQLQWHHDNPVGTSDEPIAASHKGPIMVYVTPAATEGKSGWVKIMEDGYTNGQSAVDRFIANKGVIDVTLPDLAAGEYLIRSEILALHEASALGKAQFYNGCGQIKVTSAGKVTLPAGVDLRTAYKTDDAGVKFDIYSGTVTNYPIPGPKVFSASSGGAAPAPAPSSSKPAAAPSTTAAAPSATSAAPTKPTSAAPTPTKAAPTTMVTAVKPTPTQGGNSGAVAQKYYQCGGKDFSGPTSCVLGTTCKYQNDYYSQCL